MMNEGPLTMFVKEFFLIKALYNVLHLPEPIIRSLK